MKHLYNSSLFLAFLALLALLFSFYLMFHTFSYDNSSHSLMIATKAWSDFGAHIPLIRSFSYGPNLSRLMHGQPVQSPLFPGEPIRYHFGFYALVGFLEKIGVRIDWAFNIPSALGFFLLIVMIYAVSLALFADPWISLLSVLFFLFNGSLSFLRFFHLHPLNIHSVTDIIFNSRFPAFGPWDGNTITAFWNLNIYTNQRHLALSYGIILCVLHLFLRPVNGHKTYGWKSILTVSALAGLLLFFNYPAALILAICCAALFIGRKETRIPLVIAGIITIPAFIFLTHEAHIGSDLAWQPGYLIPTLSAYTFIQFWIDNLGLHLLCIPLGIILAPKHVRKLLVGPILVLFILPNLIRFSPDMINNHKFFNFFLILGNMFSAYAVIWLAVRIRSKGKILSMLITTVIVASLTLSGVIDFFPIINDAKGSVADIAANPDARYIVNHTAPEDVIANSTWFYHPASIAGRSVYSGYTYFTWSYGYSQSERERQLIHIYTAQSLRDLCDTLTGYNIAFVELAPRPESYLSPNRILWNSLTADYENPDTQLKIYSRRSLCK